MEEGKRNGRVEEGGTKQTGKMSIIGCCWDCNIQKPFLIYPHDVANLFLRFTENGPSPIAIKKSSSLCSEVLPPIPRQKIPTASILG